MQQRPHEEKVSDSGHPAPGDRPDNGDDTGPTRAQKFLSFMKKWGLPIAVGTIVFSACVAAFFFPPIAMLLAPVLTPAIELIVSVIPASVSSLTAGFVAFGIVTVAATAAATAVTRLAMKGASKLYDVVASCFSKDELEASNLSRRSPAPQPKKDAVPSCFACFGSLFSKPEPKNQQNNLDDTVTLGSHI